MDRNNAISALEEISEYMTQRYNNAEDLDSAMRWLRLKYAADYAIVEIRGYCAEALRMEDDGK